MVQAQKQHPAVRQADIVSAATLSTQPLVLGAWLKPGTHVDLVGAYTPERRESDDEAVPLDGTLSDDRYATMLAEQDLILTIIQQQGGNTEKFNV